MRRSRAGLLRGGLVAAVFIVGVAVVTGLIPNPAFDRFVPRSGTDVLLLVSTATLFGAYSSQRHARVDCTRSGSAYLGGLGGAFAVSCPHCLPVLAGLLGTPVVAVYVVPLRPVVGVVSVAMIAGVIVVRRRQLVTEGPATPDVDLRCPTCGSILRNGDRTPDPEFVGGRMRMDLDCPDCTDPLAVLIEATGDDLVVRKRVERRERLPEEKRPPEEGRPGEYALEPSGTSEDGS